MYVPQCAQVNWREKKAIAIVGEREEQLKRITNEDQSGKTPRDNYM